MDNRVKVKKVHAGSYVALYILKTSVMTGIVALAGTLVLKAVSSISSTTSQEMHLITEGLFSTIFYLLPYCVLKNKYPGACTGTLNYCTMLASFRCTDCYMFFHCMYYTWYHRNKARYNNRNMSTLHQSFYSFPLH